MKVYVSDPSYVRGLLADLLRGGCIAATLGPDTLEVLHPDATDALEARTELAFFLRAWRERHPHVAVSLV